jgi:hypothetical protein
VIRSMSHAECRELADSNPYLARSLADLADPLMRLKLELALAQVPSNLLKEPPPPPSEPEWREMLRQAVPPRKGIPLRNRSR